MQQSSNIPATQCPSFGLNFAIQVFNTTYGKETPYPVVFSPDGPYIIINSGDSFKIQVDTVKNIDYTYGVKLFLDGQQVNNTRSFRKKCRFFGFNQPGQNQAMSFQFASKENFLGATENKPKTNQNQQMTIEDDQNQYQKRVNSAQDGVIEFRFFDCVRKVFKGHVHASNKFNQYVNMFEPLTKQKNNDTKFNLQNVGIKVGEEVIGDSFKLKKRFIQKCYDPQKNQSVIFKVQKDKEIDCVTIKYADLNTLICKNIISLDNFEHWKYLPEQMLKIPYMAEKIITQILIKHQEQKGLTGDQIERYWRQYTNSFEFTRGNQLHNFLILKNQLFQFKDNYGYFIDVKKDKDVISQVKSSIKLKEILQASSDIQKNLNQEQVKKNNEIVKKNQEKANEHIFTLTLSQNDQRNVKPVNNVNLSSQNAQKIVEPAKIEQKIATNNQEISKNQQATKKPIDSDEDSTQEKSNNDEKEEQEDGEISSQITSKKFVHNKQKNYQQRDFHNQQKNYQQRDFHNNNQKNYQQIDRNNNVRRKQNFKFQGKRNNFQQKNCQQQKRNYQDNKQFQKKLYQKCQQTQYQQNQMQEQQQNVVKKNQEIVQKQFNQLQESIVQKQTNTFNEDNSIIILDD